jgi:anti-anti-sigma factor
MNISQRDENGITYITVEGRIDATTASQAEEAIGAVLDGSAQKVLFDLEKLEYLSSAGLRVILGAAKRITASGGKFCLSCMNPYVKEIFEVSGFTTLFPCCNSLAEGLQLLH